MKRIFGLFAIAAVVFSTAFVFGEDMKSHKMTGTICDAKCVTQSSNLATCDTSCTERSGTAVFVDDRGTVKQIANQEMCKSHMNKHVKMTAAPSEEQREETVRIQELEEEAP
jgi:hypothetical protein